MDPARLAVIGLGENRPSQSNATAEGRNANRRVLLVILGGNERPEGDYAEERGQGGAACGGAADGPGSVAATCECRGVVAACGSHTKDAAVVSVRCKAS